MRPTMANISALGYKKVYDLARSIREAAQIILIQPRCLWFMSFVYVLRGYQLRIFSVKAVQFEIFQ